MWEKMNDKKIIRYINKSKLRITPQKKYNEKEIQQLIQKDINRDDLNYIKGLLASSYKKAGIKPVNITPEIIELKRYQLKFFREIKKAKEILNEIYPNM